MDLAIEDGQRDCLVAKAGIFNFFLVTPEGRERSSEISVRPGGIWVATTTLLAVGGRPIVVVTPVTQQDEPGVVPLDDHVAGSDVVPIKQPLHPAQPSSSCVVEPNHQKQSTYVDSLHSAQPSSNCVVEPNHQKQSTYIDSNDPQPVHGVITAIGQEPFMESNGVSAAPPPLPALHGSPVVGEVEDAKSSSNLLHQNIHALVATAIDKMVFQDTATPQQMEAILELGFFVKPPVKLCKLVRWIPPLQGLVLNVDGASKGNPGPCGGGGLVRISYGTVVLAFSYFYGVGSSILAEARAMCDGVQLAVEHGIFIAEIFSDSLTLVDCLREWFHFTLLGLWLLVVIEEQAWPEVISQLEVHRL
ncbi:hypothetical protein Taro_016541 [Colocasia esculenta]|uniref:RNase H type-1 domain-containing protein n=1 Tax=Colocasia esculenta TaxID=4460 RepID=A0A843UWK7_COLES|nr:hypothetical protein [Colocasia esculenta]